MKQGIFEIINNQQIAGDVFRMDLSGDTGAVTVPGQFVNIGLEGRFLRRPISVCNKDGQRLTLIYKVVGGGTRQLSALAPGEKLDLLTGLGNGYDLSLSGERPLLIGGGAGVPPMYWLCRELLAQGKEVTVILGFNTANEVFFEQEFRDLGARTLVMTVDGSHGEKGFVTDGMKLLEKQTAPNAAEQEQNGSCGKCEEPAAWYSFFYTCGPGPMFCAIEASAKTSGQYSFEERMGCGFGACMGCSLMTRSGSKRVCKDGPVFLREDILWS